MKNKLFLGYQYIKSFEIRFLVLVYVTLLNYEILNFLFTSSQHFYVISKYRNSRGICNEFPWCQFSNSCIWNYIKILIRFEKKAETSIISQSHINHSYFKWFDILISKKQVVFIFSIIISREKIEYYIEWIQLPYKLYLWMNSIHFTVI